MNYEYKNSDIEWLGDIPEHWGVDRIKDKTIAVVGGDWGNDPDSDKKGENIVVLRVADLEGIYFKFDDLTIRKIKDSSFKSRKITEQCLVIEKSGGGEKQQVGRVCFPERIDFDAICSNFMAKIELNNTVNLRFANYLFSALYGSKLNLPFVQQTTGIQNLNVTHYLYTKVAFPPLPEQKAIANYLDKACQRIDNIVAIKQKQVEKIEGYFFSKIKDATSIGIKKEKINETEIPYIPKVAQNWTIDRIKDVVDFNPVKSKANVGHDEIVSVYPMEFISDVGKVLNCKQKEYHELESGLNYFQNGDVIFAKITPCMENGKGAFMQNIPTRVAYGSSEFFVLRPLFRVLGKYLYYVTRSELFRKYLKANMKGAAGQQRVPSKFFQYCEIVFPESIKEQKEIINYLDNLSIKTKSLENKLNSQITTLQSYRKSLIHECVTGKKQVWEGDLNDFQNGNK